MKLKGKISVVQEVTDLEVSNQDFLNALIRSCYSEQAEFITALFDKIDLNAGGFEENRVRHIQGIVHTMEPYKQRRLRRQMEEFFRETAG